MAQAWASNGDLVQNALDNLSGSADLISVRGRATFTRPFERVEKLRRAADDRFRAKEQELEKQLRDTEDKLTALQAKAATSPRPRCCDPGAGTGDRALPAEKLRIRKELRAVRAGLDADIKGLGTRLKLHQHRRACRCCSPSSPWRIGAWRRRRRHAAPMQGEPDMTARRVAWLLVAGALVIAFAIWLSSLRHLERATLAGDLVLPGLEHGVNTVTEVRLRQRR